MSKNTYSTFFERHPNLGRAIAIGSLLGGAAVIVAGVEMVNAELTARDATMTQGALDRQLAFDLAAVNDTQVVLHTHGDITGDPANIQSKATKHGDIAEGSATAGATLMGLGLFSCLSEGVSRLRRWGRGGDKPISLQEQARRSVKAARAAVRGRDNNDDIAANHNRTTAFDTPTQTLRAPVDLDTELASFREMVDGGLAKLEQDMNRLLGQAQTPALVDEQPAGASPPAI